ncbi:TPA: tyrosine-type recombinase/integrase, partial [Pseudomonas aeruginosa]|nr:tyrosine-type recombinase/integrase [Pseudomonas aeruginosa]HEO1534337.1 tyrosine-type recombinase/integrase [Pseudomonas aeruginosa]HEO1719841.1 tyrosine-type recombinase/integrase [Pseudomonas aeruginosa]
HMWSNRSRPAFIGDCGSSHSTYVRWAGVPFLVHPPHRRKDIMETTLPSNTRALLARSHFPEEMAAFADWLTAEHYTPGSSHRHLTQLEQALPLLPQPSCSQERLHQAFAAVGSGVPSRPDRFRSTERLYGRFLTACGRLDMPGSDDPFAGLRAAYDDYLSRVRGLAASSRAYHRATVRDFLERSSSATQGLPALSAQDIAQYVALRSRQMSRASLQGTIGRLRGFLRYCHTYGHLARDLSVGIEAPRLYRDEMPPQALDWNLVLQLLQSIDLDSKTGRRDHCILHLMACYGLRPSEVTSLRLDSIDWDASTVRVAQRKTRSDLLLPLMPETMQMLGDYLDRIRRAQGDAHPQLFLRVRCPDGPMASGAITYIFETRVRQSGLPMGGHHVYRLRHTFAMRLLTLGVGVKAIGDLLGHRSIESTSVYLRLDTSMLQDVALEVPGTELQGGRHVQ